MEILCKSLNDIKLQAVKRCQDGLQPKASDSFATESHADVLPGTSRLQMLGIHVLGMPKRESHSLTLRIGAVAHYF